MSNNKKYGLIVTEKNKTKIPVFQASRNVFGNDSESDDDTHKKPVLLRPSDNINRQAKNVQSKAITEDPTVFQYDEVYDSMKTEKEAIVEKAKIDKKPKYIENLLKTANKRKIENERRIERQIQKEREQEGDQFVDKEVFVTSAYKKKLEEMSLEEEREKREEYLESIGDVTKQNDLGGFYRHIYEQKMGPDRKQSDQNESSISFSNNEISPENKKSKAKDPSQKRNYRKRKSSVDTKELLSDGEINDSEEEINRHNLNDIKLSKKHKPIKENLDADTDLSTDESSDDEKVEQHKEISSENTDSFKIPEVQENKTEIKNNIVIVKDKESNANEVKQKVDIWKKRTVGEIFDNALKRYYERKGARSG